MIVSPVARLFVALSVCFSLVCLPAPAPADPQETDEVSPAQAPAGDASTPASAEAAAEGNSIQLQTRLFHIDASWPVVGIARIDEESEAFVRGLAGSFEQQTTETAAELAMEFGKDDDRDFRLPAMFPYELNITYEVTHPSDRVVSLVWNVWSFTGGAHGQLDITTNNYDRSNGFPLLLEDLFLDPELAVLQFTRVSRQKLAEPDEGTEGESFPDDMLRAGTEPTEENFHTFTLLPDGIRIYFQPYQVAPWAAGPQTVDVSLEELKAAKPRLEYWGRANS